MSGSDNSQEEPVLENVQEQEPPVSPAARQQSILARTKTEYHANRFALADSSNNDTVDRSSASNTSNGTSQLLEAKDFQGLLQIGKIYTSLPSAGRDWLESLRSQDLIPTARVEHRPSGVSPTSYPSLLPLLSVWLNAWFEKVHKERADLKSKGVNPEAHPPPEDGDLQWLYSFTADYVSFPAAKFEEHDIVILAESVFKISRLTSLTSDVNGSLAVLHGILSNNGCPDSILEPNLELLCLVHVYLAKTTQIPADCIRLIVEEQSRGKEEPASPKKSLVPSQLQLGSNRPTSAEGHENTAIAVLYGFLRRPFDADDNTRVRAARGAVQTLHDLSDNEGRDGVDMPAFDELTEALLEGSKKHIPRLDAEILGLCFSFLQLQSRKKKILSQDWTTFAKLLESLSDPIQIWSNHDARTNEFIKQNAETLRNINTAIEQIWDRLVYEQQCLVYHYFMRSPRLLRPEQSMRVIQHALTATLFWPDKPNWQHNLTAFATAFLKETHQPTPCRVRAVEVIAETIRTADILVSRQNPEALRISGEAVVSEVLRILQDQTVAECDDAVERALVTELADIISVRSNDRAHGASVIKCLQTVASRTELHNRQNRANALHATRGLIRIFMRGLYVPAARAMLAFGALVEVASLTNPHVEARLAAMKVLFRVRCDSAGFVHVQCETESEYIAAALCRTTASAEAFNHVETPAEQRNSASSSSLSSLNRSSRPMWMYPDADALPERPQARASIALVSKGHKSEYSEELNAGLWLETVVSCLQKDAEWETYSFILVHLGAQLSNFDLFSGSLVHVNFLRRVLCEQISNASFHEPPNSTGLKKSDVAICIFNALTPLIAYTSMDHFTKNDTDELVRAFLQGIGGQWEGTARGCIHSLFICCLEIPASVARSYPAILDKMLKNVTQSHLSVHILEFLAELARLPEEHSNLRDDEIRNIFGICIRVLEIARDRKASQSAAQPARLSMPSSRHSGVSTKRMPPYRAAVIAEIGVPHYEYALAYHAMIFWFLSLKLETRANHVSWIVDRLVWTSPNGEEMIDEQSRVFIDMMQRTTFSDLGETLPQPDFANDSDGTINTASWIIGLSIVTVETAGATGRSQITKRQASGTTHTLYQQFTADTPYHHVPISTQIRPEVTNANGPVAMLPSHILLQMMTSAAPTGLANQPIVLPNEDFVKRALNSLDRNPTVDGYKMGVIYVGESQTDEVSMLANTMGSRDFNDFLGGLGTQVPLEDAKFNTQGLVNEQDGLYTIAWRDRVSEIIYHVPTLMPTNLEDDPQCINKKRHIGNDFVNIIFNRSGGPFDFNTFRSQFNYVNVIITPASKSSKKEAEADYESHQIYERARQPGREADFGIRIPEYPSPKYYKVHVLTADGIPSISPASDPKIISAAQLPSFVRLVALNACVFAKAWLSRDTDNEYPSSWRARLQEIRRLRERVVERAAAAAPEPVRGGPLYRDRGGERAKSLYPEDRSALTAQRRVVDYDAVGAAQEETLSEQLDFSQWTI